MNYNLSKIMSKAWELFRKQSISFAECLHRAWEAAKAEPVNAARIAQAKARAGITEEVNTWTGWRKLGYEVRHGSKALFGTDLGHQRRRSGLQGPFFRSIPGGGNCIKKPLASNADQSTMQRAFTPASKRGWPYYKAVPSKMSI